MGAPGCPRGVPSSALLSPLHRDLKLSLGTHLRQHSPDLGVKFYGQLYPILGRTDALIHSTDILYPPGRAIPGQIQALTKEVAGTPDHLPTGIAAEVSIWSILARSVVNFDDNLNLLL